MTAIFILSVLIPILFLFCAKINEKQNIKFLVKIGIALIVLEIITVIALMESIINLTTIGSN